MNAEVLGHGISGVIEVLNRRPLSHHAKRALAIISVCDRGSSSWEYLGIYVANPREKDIQILNAETFPVDAW